MNAFQLAKMAYANPAAPTRTERATEYALFAAITRNLKSAAATPENFPALAAALHENRRLWTILAIDVMNSGNGLPEKLRAQIFYLSEFTARHSALVLAGKADTAALIDINTAIMRGLSQQEHAQ